MVQNLNLKSNVTTSETPTNGNFPSPLKVHILSRSISWRLQSSSNEKMKEQDRAIFQTYLSTIEQIRMPVRRYKFLPEWRLQDLAKVAFLRIPEELSL